MILIILHEKNEKYMKSLLFFHFIDYGFKGFATITEKMKMKI